MSDDKKKKTPLSTSGRKTLQMKPSGTLSAGGGASGVVVQRKKKLIMPGQKAAPETQSAKPKSIIKTPFDAEKKPAPAPVEEKNTGGLSDSEREKRAKVLEQAQKDADAKAKKAAEEAKRKAVEDAAKAERLAKEAEENKKKAKAEPPAKPKPEVDEAKRKADLEMKKKAEAEAKKIAEAEAKAQAAKVAAKAPAKPAPAPKPVAKEVPKRPEVKKSRMDDNRRRGGKLTVTQALSGNMERQRSLASLKRKRAKERRQSGLVEPAKKVYREVVVPDHITVAELANRMTEKTVDVTRALMKMGEMLGPNDQVDHDVAELIVEEFGHKLKRISASDVETDLGGPEDADTDLEPRAPVVTVMGHVDHGKTSILDALRKTSVTEGEAGGITQHIGAYQIKLASGDKITFLDTPGHAAFTAMRARGAQVTDIVVLVVAADDGIMPQTIEAISHAKAAEVPIVVAINKMDAPGANPMKVRQDLLQHEVFVESMGGEILDIEVSAKQGTGLDKLEEAILLQAELNDLKANPNRTANGAVVEAKLDKGRGAVATVIIQRGTLKVGDVLVAGTAWGRVRALVDDRGSQLKEAGPSTPVELLGLDSAPGAGDDFVVVDDEAKARSVVDFRLKKIKDDKNKTPQASLENMFDKLKEAEISTVPVLLKADVQGSLGAIESSLEQLNTDEVRCKIVHSGVGGISETDIGLAIATGAPVIGFNVRASRNAADQAHHEGVEIRYYSIIYDLIDDIKAVMSGMLAPDVKETIIGTAEVLDIFNAGKGKAAGCLVTSGVVRQGAKARLLRDDVVVYEGDLGSLRRFKDAVKEVESGVECGMNFASYNDMKVGDVIECYTVEEIERSL
ncbi:translation initiation factor IF-2 [Pseudemcibacter aquimaris]|uniref:translation initiation factor IF-2 n=1 Tax=Pseudemcibacter aquimaris TaxID=2857064 RepID=UPI0020119551|nr:translation initiation factor IF-2 [Pseudemcibacter aquimaris]MCC3861882.1 translation initiation factor IF-2 [Pseudemcibacter aquimaris]WDU58635.1 translation initiation factor IF-2 [Pseudemcibacter aquimaris]